MSEVVLVWLAVLFAAFLTVYKYLTWHFDYWTKRAVAGPKPRMIYGNFPSVITGKRNLIYDIDDVYSEYKSKYRAIGVFFTRNPELLVLDPKLAQEVMLRNFRKYRNNLASKYISNIKADKFVARNPFFVTDEAWKEKRADALAGLTLHKLNLAYPIWKASAQKLGSYLREIIADKQSIELDARDLGYRFTADILGDFLWGIDTGALTTIAQPNTIVQMSQKMLDQSFKAIIHFYALHLVPFLKPLFRCRFFPEESDRFFSNLTKEAMALRIKNANFERADYLNYLLQLQEKKHLSHDDVMGHTLTVLLDGFETTAIVLYHTLFYLAKHSEAQNKLRAEILENLQDDGFLTFENLNNLTYMDQCVHETARIITPVPLYSRICTEDSTLEVEVGKEVAIARGTIIHLPVFSFHHDEEYFPEPFKYNPDRFDNGAYAEFNKQGVLMPFGDGPRICIGMRTGLIKVKTALVEILKNYRLTDSPRSMAEKKPDSQSFILGLSGEFWLQFERI